MKCYECFKELNESNAILLNEDGDFVCSQKHKERYEQRVLEISKMSESEFQAYMRL